VQGFYEKDVATWAKILNESDFPHNYNITFAAIVGTLMYLMLPRILAGQLMKMLAQIILAPEESNFIIESYLPALGKATREVSLSVEDCLGILSMFTGTMIKLIYAFLYQEKHLKVPGFNSAFMIDVGGHHVSFVNSLADLFTGFAQTDSDVNDSVNLYPGQATCKYQQGHSIWHEVSANGLLDLVYLCDHIH